MCKNGESGSSACAEELKQCEATPSCSSELAKAEEDREREADTAKIMSKAEERYNKRQDELMERERQKTRQGHEDTSCHPRRIRFIGHDGTSQRGAALQADWSSNHDCV